MTPGETIVKVVSDGNFVDDGRPCVGGEVRVCVCDVYGACQYLDFKSICLFVCLCVVLYPTKDLSFARDKPMPIISNARE